MLEYILFDLDGTLTDPKIGITESVAYALKSFGIKVNDLDTLTGFIGPPLHDSFRNFYGFSEEESSRAVLAYRERFADKGIYENSLYDGAAKSLTKLKGLGFRLAIASSKPEVFVGRIARYFSIDEFFEYMAGSELDYKRQKKSEVIEYVLDKLGNPRRETVIMVGDREHDIFGAKETGILSAGVTWGYGSRAELESAGADYIVEGFGELTSLLSEIGEK